MDIQKFTSLRKYLFHLTDKANLDSILEDHILKSTEALTRLVKLPDRENFLRTRRIGHTIISSGKLSFSIRDQDPLYQKIAEKNLEKGFSFGDFVHLLNSKVFFWAKENDMKGHYKRYEKQSEYPVILRINTEELFASNKHHPKFCRLNSGAPRCSSYHKEGAPPRGISTFQYAENYDRTPSSVREVTFDSECKLPDCIYLSKHPNKPFKAV